MIKAKIFILKSTLKGDRYACKKGGAGPHNQTDDPPLRGGEREPMTYPSEDSPMSLMLLRLLM